MKRIVWSILVGVIVLVAISCGSNATSIEQSWHSPQGRADLRRVVTVMFSHQPTVRRTAEDEMAQRLRSMGVDATPGYAVLTDQEYIDHESAKAKLMAAGYDGVIIMRLVGKETRIDYVPGFVGGYWGYGGFYDPGYLTTETIVRVETAAYSLRDGALVYSALSRTTNPDNIGSLISGVTETVAKALEKQGVVVASPGMPPTHAT